jgi:hypothetical protein
MAERGRRARRTVATFDVYRDAQRAVDRLADAGFPVEHVAIVAEGLNFVEQVTGRLTWGKAALNGALGGAATGVFLGFILGLLSLITPLVSALMLAIYGLIIGALIGALFGVIFYSFTGGERDFTSISGLQATQYHVMVHEEHAAEAERLLPSAR